MAEQQQVRKLVAVLVEHQEHFGVMSTADCQWAIQNPKDMVALFVAAVQNRAKAAAEKLLKFVGAVSLPAIDRFIAAEKFREGETVDGVKFVWFGPNFKNYFLGKTEEAVPALEAREHELVTPARDPAIVTELGGEKQVETTLGQLFEFLKTAKKGWHVRYICDTGGVLRAVYAFWNDDGWYVEAYPLDRPCRCDVGNLFLSR